MTFCIIPARGGSRGIPKKNIISLGGYPLLAWSIVPAQDAGFDVVVSTDDDEIAKVANAWGAAAHMRQVEGDGPTEPVLEEFVRRTGIDEPFVFMQCTSPFTTKYDLRGALHLYEHEGADSMFSAYPLYPYLWTNDIAPMYNPMRRKRRQDKRPTWLENGAFYITTPDVLKRGARVGGKVSVWPMDTMLEIDEPRDLELAEWMLQERPEFAPKRSRMAGRYLFVGTEGAPHKQITSQGNSSRTGYHAYL